MISKKLFGKLPDGREVYAFTIKDGENEATVLNYGAIIQSVKIVDCNNKLTDVCLGYNDIDGYVNNRGRMGAVIGRVANRIKNGTFYLNGQEYKIPCTDGENACHGGKIGFDKKLWDYEAKEDKVIFKLFSCDKEEGFPGNLKVEVIYSFENCELKIEYKAVSDKDTLVNLTNHAYFNLAGENFGSINEHVLYINSDKITPPSECGVPEGRIVEIKGTPYDFFRARQIGDEIDNDKFEQLQKSNGYDINYIVNLGKNIQKVAEVYSNHTGIAMKVYTNMPALQFYTANGLNAQGKNGQYSPRCAFCLETQFIPNAINCKEFWEYGTGELKANEEYNYSTSYDFSVLKK